MYWSYKFKCNLLPWTQIKSDFSFQDIWHTLKVTQTAQCCNVAAVSFLVQIALQLFPWTTVKWIEFFEYLWWHFRFTSRHWSSLQTFFCFFLSMNCFFIPIIKKYLPHNNYKKYRKRRKQEVARRPNRNYRSLWEVRPPRTTG